MKLIDEKGRLFGKINLIDLLVVLLIVAVLAAVVWKLGGRKAAAAVTGTEKKAHLVSPLVRISAILTHSRKKCRIGELKITQEAVCCYGVRKRNTV